VTERSAPWKCHGGCDRIRCLARVPASELHDDWDVGLDHTRIRLIQRDRFGIDQVVYANVEDPFARNDKLVRADWIPGGVVNRELHRRRRCACVEDANLIHAREVGFPSAASKREMSAGNHPCGMSDRGHVLSISIRVIENQQVSHGRRQEQVVWIQLGPHRREVVPVGVQVPEFARAEAMLFPPVRSPPMRTED
jgi:hypothetical protein